MLLSPARVVFVVSAKHNWLKRRLGGSQANYLKAIIRNKSTVEKGFVEIRDGSVFSSLSQTRSSPYRISEEVYEAILKNSQPVVALESAIITHGMPYPHNIATALHLENIIRHKGVIPATVGVIEGQLTVGLSQQDIETLGSAVKEKCPGSSKSRVVKVSRRDLPYALSQGLSGGTTVSGTIIGAVGAKIPIFVTGGLGGVHRGAESTFDISADLKELGRSPIAVISAGVKSILDIGKTLEYLETEGVCVCVLDSEGKKARRREVRNENENDGEDIPAKNIRSIKFPSFFTSESPFPAPHVLDNEIEAANLLHSSFRLELGSGILIAVPIPKEFATSGERIEKAIETALEDARREGINGKDMTPFLLGKVNELTGGDSLEANKHLIENNALVGAEIALELLRLRKETVGEEMLSSSINSGDNSHSESHHLNSGHYHYVPGTGTRTGGGLRNCGLNNVGGVERNPTISSPTSTVRGFGTTTNCLTSHNGPTNCDHSLETDQPWHLEGFKGEDGNGRGPKSSRLNDETKTKSYHSFSSSGRPVVIGGTSLDLVLNVQEEAIVIKLESEHGYVQDDSGAVLDTDCSWDISSVSDCASEVPMFPSDDEALSEQSNHSLESEESSFDNAESKPFANCYLSYEDSVSKVKDFCVKHNQTYAATQDLLKIIKLHLPKNTKYPSTVESLWGTKGKTQDCFEVYFCNKCKIEVSKDFKCDECDTEFERRNLKANGHYFLVFQLKPQFVQLLANVKIRQAISTSIQTRINSLDKFKWQRFKIQNSDLTCTFNSDGVPVFNSSKTSMWPFLLTVNELPPLLRKRFVIMGGLWIGREKPPAKLFFKPIIDQMNVLSNECLEWYNGDMCFRSKVYFLICSVDSVARPMFQGHTQFNGKYGCGWCEEKGQSVKKGNGRCTVYPFEELTLRSNVNYSFDAIQNNFNKGIKSISPFLNLQKFEIIDGFAVDYMHCVLLGVVRTFTRLWLRNNKEEYYIGNRVQDIDENLQKSDGRTHRTKIRTVPGGVGRNMAEALQKLGHSPLFISAIGNDLFGREIVRNFKENQMDMAGILTAKSPTAIYSALLNHKGECVFGLGDMTVHCDISSEMLKGHIEDIRRASIVLLDGNIPTETMSTVFEICFRYSVPLWFEPTEIRKAKKILEVPREYWSSLRYISPNLRELMSITALPSSQAEFATLEKGFDNWDKAGDNSSISMNIDMNINEILTAGNFLPTHPTLSHLISHCFSIFTGLEIILLTRGTQGFFVLERDGNSFSAMHFPAPDIHPKDLKSVSGAGDCLNAGFISGLLHQLPLEMCAGRGTHCAKKSLESTSNVPPHFKLANNGHEEDVFVQY